MTPLEVFGGVLIALAGAGGPLALWISTRSVNRAQGTWTQIDNRLADMERLMTSLIDTGTNTTRRLNTVETTVEIHGETLDQHDLRIRFLEEHNKIANP